MTEQATIEGSALFYFLLYPIGAVGKRFFQNMASLKALVILEISRASKAPDLRYVTLSTESLNLESETQEQIQRLALDLVKEIPGEKKVISTIFLNNEEYLNLFERQVLDFLSASKA